MKTRTFNELTNNHTIINERRKTMKRSIIMLGIVCLTIGLLSGSLPSFASEPDGCYYHYVDQAYQNNPWDCPKLIKRLYWHPSSTYGPGVNIQTNSLKNLYGGPHWTWILLKEDKNYPNYFWGRKESTKNGYKVREDVHVLRFNYKPFPYAIPELNQWVSTTNATVSYSAWSKPIMENQWILDKYEKKNMVLDVDGSSFCLTAY